MDSAQALNSKALAFADIYYKRSYDALFIQSLPQDVKQKIRPFGLNHATLSKAAAKKLMTEAIQRHFRAKLAVDATAYSKSFGCLAADLKLLVSLSGPDTFVRGAHDIERKAVIYQTRVWPPEAFAEDLDKLNLERIELVKKLRHTLGNNFAGGIVGDQFSNSLCPEIAVNSGIHQKQYVRTMRSASIGVYSRGVHDSLAFKLSEYLAAGLCIVSEPLPHRLPQPLLPGINYLPFRTPDECAEQCQRLLADTKLAAEMRAANSEYYRKFVDPTAHVQLILEDATGTRIRN
jgi:glycosyltransferase involved in cell wall biosynthesis